VFDPGSFRDPASRVFHRGDEVFRSLSDEGQADWQALQQSNLFRTWIESGQLIGTKPSTSDDRVISHDKIPFWSYPYEWSFSMLKSAASMHLRLLEDALTEGLTLKDATPYNVQFIGSKPIFVDIGSFTTYEPGEPWIGYRQFCRQFLYPLMVRAHAKVPFQPLLRGSLDGIPAETARSLLRGRRATKPGVAADVMLQSRAEKTMSDSTRNVRSEMSTAGFSAELILTNVRRLRKVVEKTTWDPGESIWSEYAGCEHVATQRGPKEEFVKRVAGQKHRQLVWDLGANDAYFSKSIAGLSDTVVAIDGDEATVDRVFQSLATSGPTNVLPIVMDLADPSPGLGWRGGERRKLEDRGLPDLVLMLAVVHHLVIGANLPLAAVIDWIASFDAEVVFEWVPLEDPMSQKLTANKRRSEVHSNYDETSLRSYLNGRFDIREELPLEGRRLFHLVPVS
jgi:hypothetical protein